MDKRDADLMFQDLQHCRNASYSDGIRIMNILEEAGYLKKVDETSTGGSLRMVRMQHQFEPRKERRVLGLGRDTQGMGLRLQLVLDGPKWRDG